MKKRIKLLSLILCAVFCSGCFFSSYKNEREFLYKKMDEFEIECTDYYLIQSAEELDPEQYGLLIRDYKGHFLMESSEDILLNGESIIIEYVSHIDGYKLTYQDREFEINSRFMATYSETYYNIHQIWGSWLNQKESEPNFTVSDVAGVIVYDNEVFIIVWSENVALIKREFGNIPIHMYKFNILTNELLYCGYLKKPNNSFYYDMKIFITKNK